MLAPMEILDRSVLTAIEQEVLHPAVIVKALEKAIQQLRPRTNDYPTVRRQAIQKELAKVEAALARLAQAVVEGGTLATLDGLATAPFDAVRVEQELQGYLKDWSGLAQRHPAQTRQILRKLLSNRIRVWREVREGEKVYRFKGEAAVVSFSTA